MLLKNIKKEFCLVCNHDTSSESVVLVFLLIQHGCQVPCGPKGISTANIAGLKMISQNQQFFVASFFPMQSSS